ncbi:MAG: hypothetical protein ACR2PL_06685 [Dehalococcoidia bacterium]
MASQGYGDAAAEGTAGMMQQIENLPVSAYYSGVLGSIGLSALLMLLGKKNVAIFVGLWAPTIATIGLFNKQLHPSQDLSRGDQGDRGYDSVDEMSADSFPASDPPGGSASLGSSGPGTHGNR